MIVPPSLLLAPKVQGLFAQALVSVSQSSSLELERLIQALQNGDPWVHSSFRYALAQEVCNYLTGICRGVRGVYIYGSTLENRAGPVSDVDWIVWVHKKSASLDSLLWKLDVLLLQANRALTGFAGPRTFFDFHVVDDIEVAERTGYGAILRSLWTAPMPLQLPKERRSASSTFT